MEALYSKKKIKHKWTLNSTALKKKKIITKHNQSKIIVKK